MIRGLLTSAQSLNSAALKEHAQTSCKLCRAGTKEEKNQSHPKAGEIPELPDSGAQAAAWSRSAEPRCDFQIAHLFCPHRLLGSAIICPCCCQLRTRSLSFSPLANLAVQGAERALAAGTAVARNPRLQGAFPELCLLSKWSFS